MTVALDPLQGALAGVDLDKQRATMGEYLGAVADDAWQGNPVPALMRMAEANREANGSVVDVVDSGAVDPMSGAPIPAPVMSGPRSPILSRDEANKQGETIGLKFDKDVSQGEFDLLAEQRKRQLANENVFRRARNNGDYGAGRAALSVATELVVSAADPLNIAASFLPIVPAGSRAALLLSKLGGKNLERVVTGAVEGAAGNALVEPFVAAERKSWDPDYGFGDSMANIAFGAALGGGLHWLGGRVSDWRATRAVRQQSEALPKAVDGVPLAPSAADHVPQRMAEAIDRTAPETREAATRTAIAALAEDRRPVVEPVLQLDPRWRVPEVSPIRRLPAEPGTSRLALEAGASAVPDNTRDAIASFTYQRDSMRELAARRDGEVRQGNWRSPVPDDFRPSEADMAQAMRFSRGLPPERPLPEPSSLSQWLRARGGIDPGTNGADDLRASNVDRVPGLFRKAQKGTTVGDQLDYVRQAALDAGFYPDVKARGEELAHDDFVRDLAADAHGVRRTYREGDEDVIAWRAQKDYFDATQQWMRDEGLDLKGMKPREIAWLLSLDQRRRRIEMLARRVDTLGDHESLELLDLLDREIADSIAEEIDVARAALDGPSEAGHGKGKPLTLADLEKLNGEIERSEKAAGLAGRTPRQADAGRGTDGAAERPARASDEGAAGGQEGGDGREGQGQGQGRQDGRVDAGDTVESLSRSINDPATDLLHDPVASEKVKAEAAVAEPDVREEVAELEAALKEHLTPEERAELEAVERPHDDMSKAVEALALCRVGGGG